MCPGHRGPDEPVGDHRLHRFVAQLDTNFNAPTSVATAAVLYVFRTLVDDDIPLNDGCLRPLSIVVPGDSMLAPEYPAAVVAGNVETSQAVTGACMPRSASRRRGRAR